MMNTSDNLMGSRYGYPSNPMNPLALSELNYMNRTAEIEKSFIRLAITGYPTEVERMFKSVTRKERVSWLPRRCAISRKSLFGKTAICVTLKDSLSYKDTVKTRWYDPDEFMLQVLKL